MKRVLIFTLFLVGCQTRGQLFDDFSRVKVGMTKQDVIATAGSPSWSERKNNLDLWVYFFKHDLEPKKEKVIYFRQGQVIYLGDRIPPQLSAEESDQIKEPRPSQYHHKPSLNEDQLREKLQKEVLPAKPQYNFEKL